MHRFKSAILAIFHFCQNGTFEPVREIQNFFWPKLFFWSIMKMAIRIFFRIMTQGPPNPGFMQENVQKGDFLKKPSWELKTFCCFRFLWISPRSGTLNWKRLVLLLSKILYKKCVLVFPYPTGVLNLKNLWPTIIYQFEYFGTPLSWLVHALCIRFYTDNKSVSDFGIASIPVLMFWRKALKIKTWEAVYLFKIHGTWQKLIGKTKITSLWV